MNTGTKTDRVVVGDFNGDGKTDILVQNSGSLWAAGFAGGAGDASSTADLMSRVTTGLSATTSIAYLPLTAAAVYAKGAPVLGSREFVLQAPLYVVQETTADNGLSGSFVETYFYEGLVARTDGRGVGVFYRRRMVDGNGIVTESENETSWPLAGRARRVSKGAPVSGARPSPPTVLSASPFYPTLNPLLVKVNEATTSWVPRSYAAGAGYQTGTIATISEPTSYARSLVQIHGVTSVRAAFTWMRRRCRRPRRRPRLPSIDDFGNPQSIVATTNDAAEGGNYVKTTTNGYSNDRINWIVGRLTSSSVTIQKPDGTNASRASSWTYGAGIPNVDAPQDNICVAGMVCKETIELATPAARIANLRPGTKRRTSMIVSAIALRLRCDSRNAIRTAWCR